MRVIGQSETFCGVRLVRDRREAAAGRPCWYAENTATGESTGYSRSRSGAIVDAVRKWAAVREAVRAAGFEVYARA